MKLTGEVADCVMVEWDKKLMKELKKVEIETFVYTRYKDDIEVVAESVERGTKLVGGKLIVDEEKIGEDILKSDTKITMEIIVQIANAIDPMIQLTIETPCNFENSMMPILDVEVKINKEEGNRIDFQFFEKPTKNSKVILADSALNPHAKRTILTQECLRRLRNTKVELGEDVQVKHLNNFMVKLKNSGYDKKYRIEVLDSAMKAFDKMKEDDKNQTKPLYRSRSWNDVERKKSKESKKQSWWKTGSKTDFKSVFFVPPTPGGVLAKELRERELELNKNSRERIKIVESGGIKMKNILTVKNPFQKTSCTQKWCPICQKSENCKNNFEERNIPCNTNNIGYRWICETCQDRNICKVYEGETSRSGRIRCREHITAWTKKKCDSVLYKHQKSEHTNENVKFKFEITKKFKDALTRQADEAVRINSRKNYELMNSKSEFNHPPVARVMVERKKKFVSKNKPTQLSSSLL